MNNVKSFKVKPGTGDMYSPMNYRKKNIKYIYSLEPEKGHGLLFNAKK